MSKSRKQIATEAARAAGIGPLYWKSAHPRWHWDQGEVARTSGTQYFSIGAILHDAGYCDDVIIAAINVETRILKDMNRETNGKYCCPDWCAGSGQCRYCKLQVELDAAGKAIDAAYESVGRR